jgi:diguanylate cyclase (GGDEF)-like protein
MGLRGDGRVAAGLTTDGLLRLCAAALLFFGITIAGPSASATSAKQPAGGLPTLTTTHAVHILSSKEAARAYPVHLRGVVTQFDKKVDASGIGLFFHDSTGSIYVDLPGRDFDSLSAGSLIDLRGVTDPGEFAPIVARSKIKVFGFSGLPENPPRPSLVRILAGLEDGQWVEVEGIIHSIVDQDHHVFLQLIMADGPISVHMIREPGANYSGLVDAKVRIRGNSGPLFDLSRRQMIGAQILCPNLSAVKILQPTPEDPFKLPIIPIYRLLQWDVSPLLAHRVHVQGRVTLQWPGSSVCIQDATQGICAQTDRNTRLRVGELIDIAGFARAEGSTPALTDAVFISTGSDVAAPVTALPVTAEQALLGSHESQLVQIEGQLISRDLASADTTLLLSSGRYIFKAVLPRGLGGPETVTWKNGSVLRLTGICSVQLDAQRSVLGIGTAVPTSFRILMRSPADVAVLQKPSWWTPSHAILLLALALIVTLLVLAWVAVLRKRIRESEERFRHMALHDALTGLATRILLEDRLIAAVETANRHQTGLALLMVDLDRFKEINDTFGHQAGDEVLRVTADRLLEAVRKSDTVARMGGDEFVVLLADLLDPQIAERIAANIVKTLAVSIPFEGREMPVSASVGVFSALAGELDVDSMLKNVDVALYRAKERGRNCFVVFTPELAGVHKKRAY